ncbi:hypothetical protein [Clostridioides difficile]|uniref:hypothetical protein n=1 Tax=Clostridioides difficile TaxID=1496 RepID=UPI0013EFBAFD|nr:hypothetical protein [Clostridioides difficile]
MAKSLCALNFTSKSITSGFKSKASKIANKNGLKNFKNQSILDINSDGVLINLKNKIPINTTIK